MAVLRLLPDVEQDVCLLRHHHALAYLHTESDIWLMLHRLLWTTCPLCKTASQLISGDTAAYIIPKAFRCQHMAEDGAWGFA